MTKSHSRYNREEDKGAYLPTAEEIAKAAAGIRSKWDDEIHEERIRADWRTIPLAAPGENVSRITMRKRTSSNDD